MLKRRRKGAIGRDVERFLFKAQQTKIPEAGLLPEQIKRMVKTLWQHPKILAVPPL